MTPSEHPVQIWVTAIVMAGVVAFAVQPLISMLVTALEEFGLIPASIIPVLITQALVFVLALMNLRRIVGLSARIGQGLVAAGALLMAALPAIALFAVATMLQTDTQDTAAAAFFLVLIFGGFYGGLGLIVFIIGRQVQKRRAT